MAVVGLSTNIKAQSLEITPSFGYMFNGKIQFSEGVVDLQNGSNLGLSIGTNMGGWRDIELDYTWGMNMDLIFNSDDPLITPDFQTTVNIHQISITGINYFVKDQSFRPFFNLGVGLSYFDVEATDADDPVRLSLNIGLGAKYDINDRIGIRLQSRLIAPVHFEGVGVYAGVGTGGSSAGLTLNASVPIFQADVRAGVVIKIGK